MYTVTVTKYRTKDAASKIEKTKWRAYFRRDGKRGREMCEVCEEPDGLLIRINHWMKLQGQTEYALSLCGGERKMIETDKGSLRPASKVQTTVTTARLNDIAAKVADIQTQVDQLDPKKLGGQLDKLRDRTKELSRRLQLEVMKQATITELNYFCYNSMKPDEAGVIVRQAIRWLDNEDAWWTPRKQWTIQHFITEARQDVRKRLRQEETSPHRQKRSAVPLMS